MTSRSSGKPDGSKPTRNEDVHLWNKLILTCLEAQLLMGRVLKGNSTLLGIKIELIAEIRRSTPKSCPIDAKAD
jgi:hypothetical protein